MEVLQIVCTCLYTDFNIAYLTDITNGLHATQSTIQFDNKQQEHTETEKETIHSKIHPVNKYRWRRGNENRENLL